MSKFYTQEQISALDLGKIPKHVAIIPDGNRRWAMKQKRGTEFGHRAGCDILMDIVEAADEIGIDYLTFYTFSTENWRRSKLEIDTLMALLEQYLTEQRPRMVEKGVKLLTIGDLKKLPPGINRVIEESKKATEQCTSIHLILALNYGSREEICRAVRKMIAAGCTPEEVNEERLSHYLDTSAIPDPELLIRSSGEKRLSNYLLWQSSYTEIFLTETLWPDFRPIDFLKAIEEYQRRERRIGS